ncbi:MAG: hypothetical protein JNM94_14745 [Phycisphaerae bacterium]|nr:hypothetical protein [Phycisphaerae bacterium]
MRTRRSRRNPLAAVVAAWCVTTASSGFAAAPPTSPVAPPPASASRADSMDALATAPANATAWIRVRDGRALFASPEARALVSSFARALLDDAAGKRWAGLASRLGWSDAEAFDRLLGRDVRVVLDSGRGAPADWALLTAISDDDMGHLVRSLRLTIGAGAAFELPEDNLRLAYRDGWLAIGPIAAANAAKGADAPAATRRSLFDDLADRGALPTEPAADAVTLERALVSRGIRDLPPGRISSAFRIGAPIDAACAVGADIVDGELKASVRGAFAEPPFPGLASTTLDIAVLARFASSAIVASVDPISTEVAPDDAPIIALVPEIVPHGTFRANLGERRLILIGDLDGSTRSRKSAMRVPEIAVAYEVDDAQQARDDQDAYVAKAYAAIVERFAKPAGIDLASPSIPGEGIRIAPIGPALAAVTEDHPLVRSWCLSWQVVEETKPDGQKTAWQVYATDPDWLRTVSDTLAKGEAACAVGAASAGCASGERLAAHLRSWDGEAAAFVGKKATPDDIAEFRAGIELLASIAERFGSMHWTVSVAGERLVGVDLKARLTPPRTDASVSPAEPARERSPQPAPKP